MAQKALKLKAKLKLKNRMLCQLKKEAFRNQSQDACKRNDNNGSPCVEQNNIANVSGPTDDICGVFPFALLRLKILQMS